MRELRRVVVLLIALVGVTAGVAAEGPVRLLGVRFEPAEVLIGDHFELIMDVEAEDGSGVAFPAIDGSFAEGRIELLEDRGIDTLAVEGGTYRLRKSYRLTCFEPAQYRIDSVGVLGFDGNKIDTLFSPAGLEIEVALMPVDTAQKTIYDIRQPLEAPLVVEEFSGYVFFALFAAAVLASLVWLVVSRSRRAKGREEQEALPRVAPHIVAIRSLERLANQKLWQNGRYKEYYSRLTEILREYLSGRFGVGAMEMTSDEIVEALKGVEVTEAQRKKLESLLRESDLVKFAKHTPDGETNEESYTVVYYFVEETKEVAEEIVAPEEQRLEGVSVEEKMEESSDEK